MVSFPFCKINLGLQIVEKRTDGYHNLKTCFYPIPWTDVLEIIPSREFSFHTTGIEVSGNAEDNLCVKAYQLLKSEFRLPPVQIHLHKIIPMGAGLGGGSSDAAFALRLLNEVFQLQLTSHSLIKYASVIGSDCSFFINDHPKFGEGRGEILSDISVSLKGKYIVMVKPPIHVSTAAAFAGIVPPLPTYDLKNILETVPMNQWKNILRNDFEKSVFKQYPAIEKIKEKMYSLGAEYSSMSGSGSTVFGLFSQPVGFRTNFADSIYFSARLER
jgi:4-diphosphocytidyl-2-C-methyl-D-erythritol kinase